MLKIEPGTFIKSTTLGWDGMVMLIEGEEAEVAFLVPAQDDGYGTFYDSDATGAMRRFEIEERRVTLGTLHPVELHERLRLSLAVLGGTQGPKGLSTRQEMILGVWKPFRHGDDRIIAREEMSQAAQSFVYSLLAPLLPGE